MCTLIYSIGIWPIFWCGLWSIFKALLDLLYYLLYFRWVHGSTIFFICNSLFMTTHKKEWNKNGQKILYELFSSLLASNTLCRAIQHLIRSMFSWLCRYFCYVQGLAKTKDCSKNVQFGSGISSDDLFQARIKYTKLVSIRVLFQMK